MPRLARKYLESPFLHVIVQGIEKSGIFQEDSLKSAYKTIIKRNLSETSAEIIAYCIMDNHAHFLLYSEKHAEISKIMHKTNTAYARLYNHVKQRVGYVFRDRYYVQMILSERQLYNCIVYIHKNPINANIVNHLKDYKYSSYNEYINVSNRNLITEQSIKLSLGSSKDYLNTFYTIHKLEEIEDIKDVVDTTKDTETLIEEYLQKNNKSLEEIKLDNELLGELLLILRYSGGLSLRKMSEIININKDKINKIINERLV